MQWFGWLRRKPEAHTRAGAMMLEASVTDQRGGRVRVVGVPYALPADGAEFNRLDFQHYMLRFAFQGNYAAPLDNPRSILDMGTGTGRWAIEMAQAFQHANVIGLDIKPPAVDERGEAKPDADPRPPNYTFVPGNLLEGLQFADRSFDYVHQRLLFTAILHDRRPSAVQELIRVTRPGGWIELVDSIGLANGGPNVEQLMDWIRRLSTRRGVDLMDGKRIGDYLRATSLVNRFSRRFDLPTGVSGGRLGKMVATDFFSVCAGYGGMVSALGVATEQDWNTVLTRAQNDLNNPAVRCVTPFFIAYGQRPA